MRNPWDRPDKFPTAGEDSIDKIYLSVGRAIASWENLESTMAALFASFTGGADSIIAKRSYGTLNGPTIREKMLKSAAEAHFEINQKIQQKHPALKSRCELTIKHYRKLSDRRNEITHGIPDPIFPSGGWLLKPSPYLSKANPLFASGAVDYVYNCSNIDGYANAFNQAAAPVAWCFNILQFTSMERETGLSMEPYPPEPPPWP